jgi:hypothetical protein
MADRNSIVEKIRALLAKTTENGATEAEMLAALDKAAAMQDAYEVSDEELRLTKEEKVMLHADAPDLSDPHKIKWQISGAVGKFCNVQIYRHRGETGLRCIGLPNDVEYVALRAVVVGALPGPTSDSNVSDRNGNSEKKAVGEQEGIAVPPSTPSPTEKPARKQTPEEFRAEMAARGFDLTQSRWGRGRIHGAAILGSPERKDA